MRNLNFSSLQTESYCFHGQWTHQLDSNGGKRRAFRHAFTRTPAEYFFFFIYVWSEQKSSPASAAGLSSCFSTTDSTKRLRVLQPIKPQKRDDKPGRSWQRPVTTSVCGVRNTRHRQDSAAERLVLDNRRNDASFTDKTSRPIEAMTQKFDNFAFEIGELWSKYYFFFLPF